MGDLEGFFVFFGAKTNIRLEHQKQIGTDLHAEKARLGLKVGKSWPNSTTTSCRKFRVRSTGPTAGLHDRLGKAYGITLKPVTSF